jgi:hypothetical protein
MQVYMLTNNTTNKKYVGVIPTESEAYFTSSNRSLYSDYKKLGRVGFSLIIIYNDISEANADFVAKKWIKYYRTDIEGYNIPTKGRTRSIDQVDMSGNVVRVWNTIKEAREALGLGDTDINQCLAGRNKSAGGFQWRYTFD